MQMLVHIELLYIIQILKLSILRVSVLDMFLRKLKKLLGIKTNIFTIQANNSMCPYFCTGFSDFMLAGKTLIDYTSLSLPYAFIYFLSYSKNE